MFRLPPRSSIPASPSGTASLGDSLSLDGLSKLETHGLSPALVLKSGAPHRALLKAQMPRGVEGQQAKKGSAAGGNDEMPQETLRQRKRQRAISEDMPIAQLRQLGYCQSKNGTIRSKRIRKMITEGISLPCSKGSVLDEQNMSDGDVSAGIARKKRVPKECSCSVAGFRRTLIDAALFIGSMP